MFGIRAAPVTRAGRLIFRVSVSLFVGLTVFSVASFFGSAPSLRSRRQEPARPIEGVPKLEAGWIAAENRNKGTTDWRITDDHNAPRIEGYADHASAARGETINVFVSTVATTFKVRAFRMGYYQNLGGRLIWSSDEIAGKLQTPPSVVAPTNTVQANWKRSLSVPVGDSWPPGSYLLKLEADDGGQRYIPLTVRDDTSISAIVAINAVTTWQAYNSWGGYSLYSGPPSVPSRRSQIVSFDRPYRGDGAGDFMGNEFPFVSFVESLGMDVSYVTDVDVHEHPELLLRHKAVVSLGHDEYWTTAMRDGAEKARDAGTNIAFLGANALYRHIRLAPGINGVDRLEINYRIAKDDPDFGKNNPEVTVSWREFPVNRPESTLVGDYYECNPVKADMVVRDASSWIFEGTHLSDGDKLRNVIGSEYDRVSPSAPTPRTIEILTHSPVRCRKQPTYSDMTYYTRSSGAGVFATGTSSWVCELNASCNQDHRTDPDKRFLTITANVLTAFAQGPAASAHPSRPNSVALHIGGTFAGPSLTARSFTTTTKGPTRALTTVSRTIR